MSKLQQLLVQIIIGTMAFGGIACFCPVAADARVAPSTPHAHHQHGAQSPDDATQQAGCGHEDCKSGCERGSAVASKFGGAGGDTFFQLDDAGILPPGIHALAPSPAEVVPTSSSRLHIPLPQETPVQRFDRLLD